MSQQFQSIRSPQGTGQPFYNPQKNAVNPNNPALYQKGDNNGVGFGTGAGKSKSFITRSNIYDLPKNSNSSGYVKSSTEMPPPPATFSSTNITSPTSTFSSYPGFTPPFQSKIANN